MYLIRYINIVYASVLCHMEFSYSSFPQGGRECQMSPPPLFPLRNLKDVI